MAMEIKAIPTLKGKEAEHFVKAADKAYKNQNKQDFSKHVLEAHAGTKTYTTSFITMLLSIMHNY